MEQIKKISTISQIAQKGKLASFAELAKVRLSFLVVFSAVMAYVLGISEILNWYSIVLLSLGGFLVTASSNCINQIIEKDIDKLMTRTMNRPLPTGSLSVFEAYLFAGITGVSGILLLGYYFNPISGLMGALALISYAFIYTPFKSLGPTAVFIGAIPGSMPLLIGWTAATGEISLGGIVLFFIQFFWQIPHFWSIAWLLNEDYKKAGYHLLPSTEGKNRATALQNLPFHILLILTSTIPYFMGLTGLSSLFVALICGFFFMLKGFQLAIDLKDSSAKKLMFASFIYLPIVLISFVLDKI